jgi:hypothetical protein
MPAYLHQLTHASSIASQALVSTRSAAVQDWGAALETIYDAPPRNVETLDGVRTKMHTYNTDRYLGSRFPTWKR